MNILFSTPLPPPSPLSKLHSCAPVNLYLVKFVFSSEHPTSQGTVSVEGYTIKPKHITLKNKEAIGWISNPYIWPR